MGFFDDVANIFKDVGTSATRIVTDTAIDLANVATGFQFNEDMEAAKKKMSDAGVLSAADAIEKNHYGFLKDMENEARVKYDEITRLYQQGQRVELERDQRASVLAAMLTDVDTLAQMSAEAQKLLDKASKIPDWQKWAVILDIPTGVFQTINQSATKWNEISQKLVLSGMGVNVAGGVAAGISGLSTIAKASTLLKASKLAKTGSTVGKASKFIKIGKLAGRASAVLTVASIGFDIGLSVAELESKKATLEQNLRELNEGIAEANRDITTLQQETREIGLRLYELLNSVEPSQTEESWENWVATKKQELNQARSRLVSFESIRIKAIEVAKSTKGQPYEYRVQLIASIDLEITEDEAKSIIADIDKE